MSSKSLTTRREIHDFSQHVESDIERITRQLRNGSFRFKPAHGIALARSNKKPRPIVKAPVESRIVQRSLLDVLQSQEKLRPYFDRETSFGGLEGKGVRLAIEAVHKSIGDGAKFHIRSDIQAFFTKIPREPILEVVGQVVDDVDFIEFLAAATTTELENLADLGSCADLFPIHEIGVAQGCCLSPFFGNLLLSEFDRVMNVGDIVCLRYIDDFLILAPSEKAARAAFRRALRILQPLGLSAYDPATENDKAEAGEVERGIEFLGVRITPGLIRPSDRTMNRVLASVREELDASAVLLKSPADAVAKRKTFLDSLSQVSHVLRGWGNQYSFCNNLQFMRALDRTIDELITDYVSRYRGMWKISQEDDRRRLLGVHLLSDSKYQPIIS